MDGDLWDRTVPVVHINEPNMSYETNEFIVRRDPEADCFYAGHDSGCSCYSGFDRNNFNRYDNARDVRAAFSAWISEWLDGIGHEAAAWEKFTEAVR